MKSDKPLRSPPIVQFLALISALMYLLTSTPAIAQSSRTLTMKMAGDKALDANVKWTIAAKAYKLELGYGALLGDQFSAMTGFSGSGLSFSGYSSMSDPWLGLAATPKSPLLSGYGKNGMNLSASGVLSSLSYSAAYSGYSNAGVFSFGAADPAKIGSTLVSGKGVLLLKEGKADGTRAEVQIKF